MIHLLNCVNISSIESIVSDSCCSMLQPIDHLVQLGNYMQHISLYTIDSNMIRSVDGHLRYRIEHRQSDVDSGHKQNTMDASVYQLLPNSPRARK